jgi:ubiquinone biosynthesis protein UbiJ
MATDSLPHWLYQASLEVLENSCNMILQRDPTTLASLANLTGLKLICQITDLGYGMILLPHARGLQLHPLTNADMANAGLTGTLQQWLLLWQQSDCSNALNQLDTWGDLAGMTRLLNLLSTLDIDLEGWLAGQIGHLPARELSLLATSKLRSSRRLLQWFKDSGTNFLQEETELLVNNTLGNHFVVGVTELTQALESLQQRVAMLTTQFPQHPSQE